MLLVEGLTEVCRQILILAGLSLFLEVLLPGGSLKKYTQFVMGLLLVAALLNPLLGLTRGLAPEVQASVFGDMQQILSGQSGNTEQIIAAGSNLADGARAQAAQELAGGLERQIASLVNLAAGVEDCAVEVNLNADLLYDTAEPGSWHNWGQVIIVLTVEQARQEQADNIGRAVRQTVADFYDIEPAAVQVSIASYRGSDYSDSGNTTENITAENIEPE